MRKWIALIVMTTALSAQADICDHPDYKKVCAKALDAGRKAIEPFVLRKMDFNEFARVVDHIHYIDLPPNLRGAGISISETAALQRLYDTFPSSCSKAPNCITQEQADIILPPPTSMATNKMDKRLLTFFKTDAKSLTVEIKSLADEMKDLPEEEFSKIFPDVPPGTKICEMQQYKEICNASMSAGIFTWQKLMILDSSGTLKGIAGEAIKVVFKALVGEAVHEGVSALKEAYHEARSKAAAETKDTPKSEPTRHEDHTTRDPDRGPPPPAPCPAPGSDDGGSCGNNDGGTCGGHTWGGH